MILEAFKVKPDVKCPLHLVTGLNAISALAGSVAARLVIRCKRSYGYVCSSIPTLSNNSPGAII